VSGRASLFFAAPFAIRKAGEFVVVIFEKAGGPYVVCTHNRGVVSGGPILVGLEEARKVVYFKGYGPEDAAT
jgi:hypothetical protein